MWNEYNDYGMYKPPPPPYMFYGPFVFITFLMSCVIGVAVLVGLLCGISHLAELAEEFPTSAQKVLQVLTIGVLVVHTLILLLEQFSFWRSLISIATNILYLRILALFPYVSPTQPLNLFTLLALAVETLSWYSLFALSSDFTGVVGFARVASFITFLWIVPIGLLVSLEMESTGLPISGFSASSRSADVVSGNGGRKVIFRVVKNWFSPSPH